MTTTDHNNPHRHPDEERHSHHGWLMIACCIPMLAIAVAIAASGAGFGFLFFAIMCTVMMAAMMGGMSGGGDADDGGARR